MSGLQIAVRAVGEPRGVPVIGMPLLSIQCHVAISARLGSSLGGIVYRILVEMEHYKDGHYKDDA